jgi:hypothetical protein
LDALFAMRQAEIVVKALEQAGCESSLQAPSRGIGRRPTPMGDGAWRHSLSFCPQLRKITWTIRSGPKTRARVGEARSRVSGVVLHIRRVKNNTPSTHPIRGNELRALRHSSWRARHPPSSSSGSPFTTAGFARMIERAAAGAEVGLKAHQKQFCV